MAHTFKTDPVWVKQRRNGILKDEDFPKLKREGYWANEYERRFRRKWKKALAHDDFDNTNIEFFDPLLEWY